MTKAPSKGKASTGLLTEAELEMMAILWRIGGGAVADVIAALPPERPLAYTSVSTILRILEQKGFVAAEKAGRGHMYKPLLSRDEYGAKSAVHLVAKVFDGAAPDLVRCLVESGEVSPGDLAAMRAILDELAD